MTQKAESERLPLWYSSVYCRWESGYLLTAPTWLLRTGNAMA
jgi:hypothetical protein